MLHPFVIQNPSPVVILSPSPVILNPSHPVILSNAKDLRVNSRRISCIIRFFGLRPQNDNRGRAS